MNVMLVTLPGPLEFKLAGSVKLRGIDGQPEC